MHKAGEEPLRHLLPLKKDEKQMAFFIKKCLLLFAMLIMQIMTDLNNYYSIKK